MISRKRGDDIYIGVRPQKEIRKKQDAGGGTMPSSKKTEYTLEDIYALPDGQRAELISGQLYMMAPPSTRHQRLVNFLTTEINLYKKETGKMRSAACAVCSIFRRRRRKRKSCGT